LPTEVESINGEIVRLGIRLNIPTPYNSAMKALITKAETARAGTVIKPPQCIDAAAPLALNMHCDRCGAACRQSQANISPARPSHQVAT